MGLDESGRYLSQVWEGGTVCDKTGMPRSVEVQVRRDYYPLYVLFSFADRSSTLSFIATLKQSIG